MILGKSITTISKDWKCGKCGKIYNFDQFLKLKKIKVVEEDTNPLEQHGYTSVCECGYIFNLDRWRLHDTLKIDLNGEYRDIQVSTVDLEINQGYNTGKDLWYETMIFIKDIEEKDRIRCYYEERYETKEEAIEDHNRILNLLKNGKFIIEDSDNEKILYISKKV